MISGNSLTIFDSFIPVIRFDGEPGGEGATGGEGDIQAQIDAAVEAATAPLRANRDTILEEKRTLKQQHESLQKTIKALGGDEGIRALVATRERLQTDELGMLLADGKYEEWYEKKTSAMKADHTNQITALEEKVQTAETKAEASVKRLSKMFLRNEIGAAARNLKTVQEEAVIDDICRLAEESFSFSEEHDRCVIKDSGGGILPGKDGKTAKTTDEWLEEQKKIRRHWWPPSKSGGVEGGMQGAFDADVDVENMTQREYEEYRKKKGFRNQYSME